MVRDKFLHQVRTDKAGTEEGKKVLFKGGVFVTDQCVDVKYYRSISFFA